EPLLEAARAYLVPETAVRHGDEEAPRVFRLDEIAQRSVLPLRHRSTRIRLSDQRARLELPRIRALQVPSAADYERLSMLGQDVLQDDLGGMAVARRGDRAILLRRVDLGPIDRRLAEPDSDALLGRQHEIRLSHVAEEAGVAFARNGGHPTDGLGPDLAQLGIRNRLAGDIAVDDILVRRTSELDDDVAHFLREPRVLNDVPVEIEDLRDLVSFADTDERVGVERLENS